MVDAAHIERHEDSERSWWHVAVTAMFVLAIFVPGLGLVFTWSKATTGFENRTTADWPPWHGWSTERIRNFTADFDRAFNDRFALRDQLLQLHNAVGAVAFGKSPTSDVVIGKNGWLYLRQGLSLDWFTGDAPLPAGVAKAIAEGITARARAMREAGIPYRVVIAPDKHGIYPEFLPRPPAPGVGRSVGEEAVKLLPDDVKDAIIDVRAPLLKAKSVAKTYYATDTHWNSVGVLTAYRAIAEELGFENPVTIGDDELVKRIYHGDMGSMMGLQSLFWEQDTVISPSVQLRCAKPMVDTRYMRTYACPNANPGRLVMYVDSFGMPLEKLLASAYQQSIFLINGNALDLAWLRASKPTVVIDEAVERGATRLIFLPTQFGSLPADLPQLAEIPGVLQCATEVLINNEFSGGGDQIVRGTGWAAQIASGLIPDKLWVVLLGSAGKFAAPAINGLAEPTLRRPEIGDFFKQPALAFSAFSFSAINRVAPPGHYELIVVGKFGDRFARCAATKELDLRAAP